MKLFKRFRAIKNKELNKYFPPKKMYMAVKRQKFYWLFLLSELIRNSYSKIRKKINEIFTKYGPGMLAILVTFLIFGYVKEYKYVNRYVSNILTSSGTAQWLSAIGTVGATIIALLSISHRKSHVGMDASINYNGAYVQIMNRTKNATFIKLNHIYMCNSRGFVVYPGVDFAKFYGFYVKWRSLEPYGCYTLNLVTKTNKESFELMKYIILNFNRSLKNNPISKLKLVFLINDHYYTLTKFVDFQKIIRNVDNV